MVAKITVPGSIRRALNYNEQKVATGVAECLYAHLFLKEAGKLNFHEKLGRFNDLIILNKRAATNTVHVSLNFAEGENLPTETLRQIACAYMEKIGFGRQPYLVYRHDDAGHPHLHIVTTNIETDGKRISLHNLGKDTSDKARKEIEQAYKLVKAEDQRKNTNETAPASVLKITYGKVPTKRAITQVLNAVLPLYKYSSLSELNAVLKLYNLTADRGKADGIIYRNRGLVYRALDDQGNKIGVPVKASTIYNKPTLNVLEARFKENEVAKGEFKKNVKTSIDWIMVRPPKDFQAFTAALMKDKISVIARQNESGFIYGLTYIDHTTRCVFNGSDIGKEYSAKAIFEKCGSNQSTIASKEVTALQTLPANRKESSAKSTANHKDIPKLFDSLLTPPEQVENVPHELRKQKKKRRKPQE